MSSFLMAVYITCYAYVTMTGFALVSSDKMHEYGRLTISRLVQDSSKGITLLIWSWRKLNLSCINYHTLATGS